MMHKRLLPVLFTFLLLLAGSGSFAQTTTITDFEKGLAEMAASMNKDMPMMINDVTRLDNIGTEPGMKLIYNYTILNPHRQTRDYLALRDMVEPGLIEIAKTDPRMQTFRDNNVVLLYHYKDEKGIIQFSVEIKAGELQDKI